jgi:hypothetical protein
MKSRIEKIVDWSRVNPKSICTCGHTGDGGNSEHEDSAAIAELQGHGKCKVPGCTCQHFQWKEWTEKAKDELQVS